MDQSILSDDELIKNAQRGQMEAFTYLYERHLPTVYNRVRYRVPESDVEDVTQEIFIGVMKSLQSFRGQAQFTTWLRTLTQRRIADYYRHGEKQVGESSDTPLSEATPAQVPNLMVPDNTAGIEDTIVLRQALNRLPDHYREILLLRFLEGLKFREIARTQGQSLEATKSMYRRAMESLRSELGE